MFRRLIAYIRGVLGRNRIERELDDELRFHIEMETETHRAAGLPPEDARRAALRDLGGVTQTRETVRELRASWIDSVVQDFRYGWRSLRRSPAFTTMAVLVLALGIGVNVAAFSIVSALFFPKLPVQDPGSLVYLYRVTSFGQQQTSAQDLNWFKGGFDRAFSAMTAHFEAGGGLTVDNDTHAIAGEVVTANYFDVLGVKPIVGAGFTSADDDPANPERSVVISADLWTSLFTKDPQILGRRVRIGERIYSITGVMEPGFSGLSDPFRRAKYWITVTAVQGARPQLQMGLIGRRRPGVSIEHARSIVAVEAEKMQVERTGGVRFQSLDGKPYPYVVRPVSEVAVPSRPNEQPVPPGLLAALLAVVSIVLVIATTNIAGVLAGRGVTRTAELAVRQALGARGRRLVQQLIIESVLLSILGGGLGLVLSSAILDLYRALAPSRFVAETAFDWRVALFTLALCVGTGILVGLAPAFQALKVNVLSALGGVAASGASPRVRQRLRHGILVPQISLSIALLVAAGVHARSLMGVESRDYGYSIDGVVALNVWHWDRGSMLRELVNTEARTELAARREKLIARERNFYQSVLRQVQSVDLDGGVALASRLPTSAAQGGSFISERAYLAGDSGRRPAGSVQVSPGYFATMGIRQIEGRDFDERDVQDRPAVAVVSKGLADRFWPGGGALGQRIAMFQSRQSPNWLEVVGVVAETVPPKVAAPDPVVYTALSQNHSTGPVVVVGKTTREIAPLVQALKTAVISADTFAEVHSVQTLRAIVDEQLFPRRAAVWVLVTSGVVGLLLACIGLYGVISHSVAQRMREIGIRATLGANLRELERLIVAEAVRVAVFGAVPGLVAAFMALRATAALVHVGSVPTFDVMTFILVPAAALVVVLLSSYIPARRAARMDPLAVLRSL